MKDSVPDLSVGKHSGQWQELGPGLNSVLAADDWGEMDQSGTLFSVLKQAHCIHLFHLSSVVRTRHPTRLNEGNDMSSEQIAEEHLYLRTLWSLWSKSPYDFGCMKNAKTNRSTSKVIPLTIQSPISSFSGIG